MKTAVDIVVFLAIMFGLLIGWMLMDNDGSLKSPVTWVLFLIGVAIESAIMRALYKDRKN